MNLAQLAAAIRTARSYLCVGLDSDLSRLPPHLSQQATGLIQFNKAIIEATASYCVAYKINTAFYESLGSVGWQLLEETMALIPPTHLRIADAKRGDIGNTSHQYARAFFRHLKADAVTVVPYMGRDSVQPFLDYTDKWTILLALTSNRGAHDFQMLDIEGRPLYAHVMQAAMQWGTPDQLMFVCGATHADQFARLRAMAPDHFFLVPGIGAQGGDLQTVSRLALNRYGGLLINASRSILYASSGTDFAQAAAREAERTQKHMHALLVEQGL